MRNIHREIKNNIKGIWFPIRHKTRKNAFSSINSEFLGFVINININITNRITNALATSKKYWS